MREEYCNRDFSVHQSYDRTDEVSRLLSLLGVSACDISSAVEIRKVESGEFSIVYGSPESWVGDIRMAKNVGKRNLQILCESSRRG